MSTRALRGARQTWQSANVRNYDLEWTSTGQRTSHYLVYVRGGRVRSVRMVLSDPRQIKANHGQKIIEVHPGDPEAFGVDGLFRIIEEELDTAQDDEPFGARKGTRVLLKFTPDEALGYPRRYRRDVVGANRSVAIDVRRLETKPAEGIPPLPS